MSDDYLDEHERFTWTCEACGDKESVRGAFMATGPNHVCTADGVTE